MITCHADFETRSTVDIGDVGAYVYAQHPTTDILWLRYAIDDGPVEYWRPGDKVPLIIHAAVDNKFLITAHNANFERCIWRHILTPRYGFPEPAVEQWRCTMAMGYAMALPGKLEHLGPALNTGFAKDMEGHRLMLAMCKPRKARKGEPKVDAQGEPIIYWRESPEDIERLGAYCGTDVEAERAADKRLVRLRPFEQDLWHLDQRINDRGVPVDTVLAERALAIVEAHGKKLDAEMAKVTDWEVTACSNVNQLKEFVRRHGTACDSLDKEHINEILARDCDPRVRRALELRQEGGKASVDKIEALLNGMSADGRARGLTQFHAANTGRWGGRRFQPQNILRPDENFDIDGAIEVLLKYEPAKAMQVLDAMYGDPITCISYTLRGMIRAEPGNKIVAADFSGIESRVLAWLAGEDWKLKYFRDFDAGLIKFDSYIATAAKILGISPEQVDKLLRQIYGKVPELACGFGGGVGAFQTMAHTYGVKIPDEKADEIKTGWRDEHPATCGFWPALEYAVIRAVTNPGKTAECGRIRFKTVGSFLWCQLPSGRALCYPYPKIMSIKTPWGAMKDQLTFKTVPNVSNMRKIVDDPTNTSKWSRISTYGGALSENVTQAVARDVLAEAMVRLERENYPIILTVHDESVSEVAEGYGSADEYEQIMADLPVWATGLPVAASGFEAERYRK